MNLKFNLSTVNTILMIVVLILVIVACVKKSRENFDPYYLDKYCEDTEDLVCLRGSDDAAEGTEFADIHQDLNDEGMNLKDWSKNTSELKMTGKASVHNQVKILASDLYVIATRLIRAVVGKSDGLSEKKNTDEDENHIIVKKNYMTLVDIDSGPGIEDSSKKDAHIKQLSKQIKDGKFDERNANNDNDVINVYDSDTANDAIEQDKIKDVVNENVATRTFAYFLIYGKYKYDDPLDGGLDGDYEGNPIKGDDKFRNRIYKTFK